MKDIFSLALICEIAAEFRAVDISFDADAFIARSMEGLNKLELTGRAAHIADAMRVYLPVRFAEAAAVIDASLGPELPPTGKIGGAALRYMPHVLFVRKYGLDDYEAAMRVQAELTKRFTAEFSIRAFLVKYPERSYEQMLAWADDDNAHLRRLASEGMRPRLPWAPRLRAFQHNPRPVIELLERLRDDPVPYVRRSVANNLNDIAKDHPELVIETCRRWAQEAPEGRTWIVRHALRSLVATGNQDAIRILGGAANPSIRLSGVAIAPQRVTLGGNTRVSFEVVSTAQQSQRLLIGYTVHFVKANGSSRAKFFRLRTLTIHSGEKIALSATMSLATMTTRRHFPGNHRIDAIINGEAHPLGNFEVITSMSVPA